MRPTTLHVFVTSCLALPGLCLLSCGAGGQSRVRDADADCALVITDDDITSGHASAGALYVGTDALGRRLLTADVVAVVEGFKDAGIECVHVLDSHDGAIDAAPIKAAGAALMTPSNTPDWSWPFLGPMRRPYRAAALVGFHSNAGQVGFRAHTVNDSIRHLRIGGQPAGEVSHLALGLGAFDVPVVLVSGDFNATAEAGSLLPEVGLVTLRWFDEAGAPRFMAADEAAPTLRAATTVAVLGGVRPLSTRRGTSLELSTWSAGRMADLGPQLASTWREALQTELGIEPDAPVQPGVPSPAAFDDATIIGRRVLWTAPDALTAFLSIAHAATSVRGTVNTWDLVSRGYKASEAGQHDDAIDAYREALSLEPHDIPTRCRLGQALEDAGRTEEARAEFRAGFERLAEVGGSPMKVWCSMGLGRLAMAAGDLSEARSAALQLLAMTERGTSHELARQWLAAASQGPAMPAEGGLEGFFPVEAVDAAFVQQRGLDIDPAVFEALLPRVGKLVTFKGEATGDEASFSAEEQAVCGLPRSAAFNGSKCAAYDSRRCGEQGCATMDFGNCSGLFVANGVFVTAAHCTDGLLRAPELLARSRIVRFERGPSGWRGREYELGPITTLKAFAEGWLTTDEGQVDVAIIRFEDDAAPLPTIAPAPVPPAGAPLWTLGYPRSSARDEAAMAQAGYGDVNGELSASFGRVLDPNPADAPLCSTTGLQDEWALVAPCERGQGTGDDGEPIPTGPLTYSPFLGSIDSMNGYSGAPLFDAQGRWVGVNSTVYGADPREGFAPEMRPVHIKATALSKHLD